MTDCIFCKIASREIPAQIIWESELVVAFRDIQPLVKFHILIIPRQHIVGINDITSEHAEVLNDIFRAAREIAVANGIDASGFRTIINTNRDAGQEIPHLHMHLLGGEPLGPMRCQ